RVGAERAVVAVLQAGGAGLEDRASAVGDAGVMAAAGERDASQRRLPAALIGAGAERRFAGGTAAARGLALLPQGAGLVGLTDEATPTGAARARRAGRAGRTRRAGRARGARGAAGARRAAFARHAAGARSAGAARGRGAAGSAGGDSRAVATADRGHQQRQTGGNGPARRSGHSRASDEVVVLRLCRPPGRR